MRTALKYFSKSLDVLENVLKFIVAASMLVMVTVIFYQVILRYFFHASNIWSEELARYLMCYVVLLGAAIAIRSNAHLKVDFLIALLKPRASCIASIVCTAAAAIFLVFFFQYAFNLCLSTTNSVSSGTGIQMSYVYACLPIGAGVMFLNSLEIIMKEIIKYIEIGKEGGAKA
jgi:TRAP-type C4-dicarboxylate transport system permease small subunit